MIRQVFRRLVRPFREQQTAIGRDIRAIAHRVGSTGADLKCDATTPRIVAVTKDPKPLIIPHGDGWMSGAVYDARPIHFRGRRLYYFCGQPSYRTDMHLFVGLAEEVNGIVSVRSSPVIVPDVETRGIDIPSYAVVGNRIVGIYADDFGPDRTGKGTDADFIVVASEDCVSFTKHRIETPLRDLPFSRIGLPWLLNDNGTLLVYFRAKNGGKICLVRSFLDIDTMSMSRPEHLGFFPRNPINIAVRKLGDGYFIFYGETIGGGFYFAPSSDGRSFDFSKEAMFVSDFEWGWDYRKIGFSPDNTTKDEIEICYVSGTPLSVGRAVIKATTAHSVR